jgi:hypothetical protein
MERRVSVRPKYTAVSARAMLSHHHSETGLHLTLASPSARPLTTHTHTHVGSYTCTHELTSVRTFHRIPEQ